MFKCSPSLINSAALTQSKKSLAFAPLIGYVLKKGIIMLKLSENLVHTPWVRKTPHSCACALKGYSYFLPVFIPLRLRILNFTNFV